MTDFAPDSALSFFEQRQRAKQVRARLMGKPAQMRVNIPIPEPDDCSGIITDFSEEHWRTVAAAPQYKVSSWGRVRHRLGGARKINNDKDKVPRVFLSIDKAVRTFRVRNLVAAAFLGPAPHRHIVRHRNGDLQNCRLENLYYAPIADSRCTSPLGERCSRAGERNGRAKLSAADVAKLREMRGAGAKLRDIARAVGVSVSQVSNIIKGKAWGGL
jgi:hypothetical protein